MASLTDRQAARERLTELFLASLDRIIPADESLPLKGGTFREWEDQADEFDRAVSSAILEERAALEGHALVESAGRCPGCSSTRVYLIPVSRQVEVQTPHGSVVLTKQACRCRACGRCFSPSGAAMGAARGGGPIASGR